MTSYVQYHFHNVSARDLLVSGETKQNGWHQVPTICYSNFFQAFCSFCSTLVLGIFGSFLFLQQLRSFDAASLPW